MSIFKKKTPYQKAMAAIKDKKFGVAKKELIKATNEANIPEGITSFPANSLRMVSFGCAWLNLLPVSAWSLPLTRFSEGDYDNAQHNFEQALAMDPRCGAAMHHMAVLMYTTVLKSDLFTHDWNSGPTG